MDTDLKAVGVHVFAGGFTQGVQRAGWRVDEHLETHGFALETAQRTCGVETINCEAKDWPRRPGLMAFGNPRCTAFSTLTSGDRYEDSNAHGAFAKQTCDVQELCAYTAGHYDFVVWESVQQAFTGVGNDLVKWCIDTHFAPKNYRIAHLLINAGTFGNAQQRRRYFFVAYRDCYRFNIQPPPVSEYYSTLYDAIYDMRDRPVREVDVRNDEYDADCCKRLGPNDQAILPVLPNGWGKNTLAKYGSWLLTERDRETWDLRCSELPFSLHCVSRVHWCRPCPTLHSSACNWVHPDLDRTLSVGELSAIMGWGDKIPVGPNPSAQLAKGICPEVGEWLAEQVRLSYTNHWGSDDWESSFDDHEGAWVGGDATGQLEKTFDMTRYVGKNFDEVKHAAVRIPRHRHNVDRHTGRVMRPWREVIDESRRNGLGRASRLLRDFEGSEPELLAELEAASRS